MGDIYRLTLAHSSKKPKWRFGSLKLYKSKPLTVSLVDQYVGGNQCVDEDIADAEAQSEQPNCTSSLSSASSTSLCQEVLLVHQDKFKTYFYLKEPAHPILKTKYEEFLTSDGSHASFPLFEENSIMF